MRKSVILSDFVYKNQYLCLSEIGEDRLRLDNAHKNIFGIVLGLHYLCSLNK